jgi:hypothetical protein
VKIVKEEKEIKGYEACRVGDQRVNDSEEDGYSKKKS